tara:strand:- start:1336 stop:1599 length:264 start_codon:yes stop_codon:yes gene_type:complete
MGAWESGYDAGYQAGYAAGARGGAFPTMPKARKAAPKKQKKPRKLTAHNRFMKKEMRALRRKHPRMKQPQIMKKANVAWRRHKRSKK